MQARLADVISAALALLLMKRLTPAAHFLPNCCRQAIGRQPCPPSAAHVCRRLRNCALEPSPDGGTRNPVSTPIGGSVSAFAWYKQFCDLCLLPDDRISAASLCELTGPFAVRSLFSFLSLLKSFLQSNFIRSLLESQIFTLSNEHS